MQATTYAADIRAWITSAVQVARIIEGSYHAMGMLAESGHGARSSQKAVRWSRFLRMTYRAWLPQQHSKHAQTHPFQDLLQRNPGHLASTSGESCPKSLPAEATSLSVHSLNRINFDSPVFEYHGPTSSVHSGSAASQMKDQQRGLGICRRMYKCTLTPDA